MLAFWLLDLEAHSYILSHEGDVGLEMLVVVRHSSSLAGYEYAASTCVLGWRFGGLGL